MDTPLKQCTRCNEFKPATTEYFARRTRNRDGFQERCKACVYRYRAENKEKVAESARRSKQKNADKIREGNRRYREKNQRKVAEWHRRYGIKHKDRKAERYREWSKANRPVVNAKESRRRARKRNADGTHTASDILRQYESQFGKCYYCAVEVGDVYHVDHVIPLSRGGSNGPENLVIACPTCNMSKNDKLLHEWLFPP